MEFDKTMLAYCGLYCEQCSFRVAFIEGDEKHINSLPYPWAKRPLADYECGGCKGRSICGHCDIFPCASKKDIDTCADCAQFPCEHITAFANDGIPHHSAAIKNLYAIRENGMENWFMHIAPTLACPCGTRQTWYYTCQEHTK